MSVYLRMIATLIYFFLTFRMASQISRRKCFDVWFANAKQNRTDALLHLILQELGDPSFSEDILKSLKVTIRSVCQKIEQKWSKSGRHRERFLNANSSWLEESISLPNIVTNAVVGASLPTTSNRAGRSQKDFASCSNRTKSELGLLVDMPKQQTGNTNDGNTARKFFRNSEKSAEITGVSVELIKRFHVILECINSGLPVNIEKFGEYTKETRKLYFKEYPWYSMVYTKYFFMEKTS